MTDDEAWAEAVRKLRETMDSEPHDKVVYSDMMDSWHECLRCGDHFRQSDGHDPDECIVRQVLES